MQVQELLVANGRLQDKVRISESNQLALRVEELEDIIVELKAQNSVQQLIDLKQVITRQSAELTELNQKLKQLTKTKLRSQDLFESNELYESFQVLLKEKDVMIAELIEN